MKIGILTDSTACISDDYVKRNNIKVVSLKVIVDGKIYNELNEITNKEVFDGFKQNKKVTSSQPSPEQFLQAYKEMKEQGYTDILCILISSKLSGTLQSAKIASEMIEGVNIQVFDTLTTAMGIELFISKAIEFIDKGYNIEKVYSNLIEYRKNSDLYFTIDDLNTLVRTGRLSKTMARIGNFLKVKPILETYSCGEGEVRVIGKARTHSKVINVMIEKMREVYKNKGNLNVFISYVGKKDIANDIYEKIRGISEDIKVKVSTEVRPVLAIQFGEGGYGIAWSSE